MLDWIRFSLTALLLVSGVIILCLSVFGIFRFKFVLNRMHVAAMGDTLGLMLALLGLLISADQWSVVLKLILIVLFLWLASPVSSHLIARLELTLNPHPEEEMEIRNK